MKLIEYLHKYFGFNKRERNGLVILLGLIVILIIIRVSIPFFTKSTPLKITKLTPLSRENTSTVITPDVKSTAIAKQDSGIVNKTLFTFDPNKISVEEAKQLGFKDKTAKTLIHFREKGGKFFKKEDLKKLYGISDKFYSEIESYVLIEQPEKEKIKNTFGEKKYEPSSKQIEINTADSIQFLSLPMIGPAMTKRILKFRNALGGFYSVEQLREVYGMKDSVFTLISNRLIISTTSIKKINVNVASYEEMKKHPYLNHVVASTIVAYRQKHGAYKSMEDLKKVGTLSEELIVKLTYYFSYN